MNRLQSLPRVFMSGPLQSNQINRTALGNKGLNFIEEITGHKCLMLIFNTYFKYEILMLCKLLESRKSLSKCDYMPFLFTV